MGNFAESKKTAGVYGLKNVSAVIWSVTYPEKPAMTYEPGKTVTLIPGTVIKIGNTKAEVVSATDVKNIQ